MDAGRRTSLEETLLALMEIPSPTGSERAIADHVCDRLARMGWEQGEIRRIGNNLVVAPPEDGRPSVALVGHLDTVPQAGCGPVRVDEQRIWGRGSTDMKGGLACMLELARSLGCPAGPYRPVFLFYDREEGPYAENGLESVFASLDELSGLDSALVLEPTRGQLHLGTLGALHVRLRVRGRAAHSAQPWEGENAIHAFGPILVDIAKLPVRSVELEGLSFRGSVSVTTLSSGTTRNVIPDLLEANVNVRFAPDRSPAQALQRLQGAVAGRAELEVVDSAPAALPYRGHPTFQALQAQGALEVATLQGWTDVARFAARGIPAANFGPGDLAVAHRNDEHIERRSLGRTFEALRGFFGA